DQAGGRAGGWWGSTAEDTEAIHLLSLLRPHGQRHGEEGEDQKGGAHEPSSRHVSPQSRSLYLRGLLEDTSPTRLVTPGTIQGPKRTKTFSRLASVRVILPVS